MSDETKAADGVRAALQRRAEEIAALPLEERDGLRAVIRAIERSRVTQKGTLSPEQIEQYLIITDEMTETLVEMIDASRSAAKS
jgi:hypothetical protein